MGSSWSQFKKTVERGDEKKSIEIYNKYSEIRRNLNANSILNETTLDTYMHVSAKQGMVEFLKLLLYENNGNPNTLNRNNQNVLHACCDGLLDSIQYECMQIILQWHEKAKIKSKTTGLGTEININEQDVFYNTPLHYAVMRNSFSCVQSLVAHGAFLFVENIERCTPCDLAEQYGQKEIALYLESKMMFCKEDDDKGNGSENETIMVEQKYNYGLRTQDLQEEKDKLLLEVAEALNCNIFTAEIMLKKHSWSKEGLLNSWMNDPKKCFEKCGISKVYDQDLKSKDDEIFISNNAKYSNDHPKNASGNETFLGNFLDSNHIVARKPSARHIKSKTFNTINTDKVNHDLKKPKSRVKKHLSASHIFENMKNSSINFNIKSRNEKTTINSSLNENDPTNRIKSLTDNELVDSICQICFNAFPEKSHVDINVDRDIDDKSILSSNSDLNNFVNITCQHKFCRSCWEQYLTLKIKEGNVTDIVCPQLNCYTIIPHETIERLVSTEVAKRYLQFDIKAFVDSNPNIKWCPFPGCGMAIKNPRNFNKELIHKKVIIPNIHEQHNVINEFSMTVDCGKGHFFCWDCLQESHEPASCQNWKDWFDKILELDPETLSDTDEKEEQSANILWLVTNSKKCPNNNCLAPIQKHEGCNHVKCYKCKYEFCWVCMEPWKKHSGATGGYFQCNRYEATNKMIQKTKETILDAEIAHSRAVESNKFIHYYTRFKNHEYSLKIEEPLLKMAKTKFETLIRQDSKNAHNCPNSLFRNDSTNSESIMPKSELDGITRSSNRGSSKKISSMNSKGSTNDFTKSNDPTHITEPINCSKNNNPLNPAIKLTESCENYASLKECNLEINPEAHLFIEEAIKELLKARRILRCSYVYGYYLDQFGHRKFIFEYIQTEFEESTENLSQIIARPHLKTSNNKIIRLTNILKRKRIEFLDAIQRGLNSFNDTPPAFKKYSLQRWKYLLKDNIQHDEEFKNTVAVNLKELNPKNPWIIDKKGRHTNLLAMLNDMPELEQELDNILVPSKDKHGLCARGNCTKPKSVNTLSGSICNYCSVKCMRIDRNNYLERKDSFKAKKSTGVEKKELAQNSDINATTSKANQRETDKQKKSSSKYKWKGLRTKKKNSHSKQNLKKEAELSNIEGSYKSHSNDSSNRSSIQQDLDQYVTSNNLNSLRENIQDSVQAFNHEQNLKLIGSLENDALGNSAKIHHKIEYSPLFLNKNEEEISCIIKNMENVICDSQAEISKIQKITNFNEKILTPCHSDP